MNNTELLHAISDMMDQKLEEKLDRKLEEKLDKKFDEKLEPVICRLGCLEGDLTPRIKNLEDNLIPRVKNLEDNLIPRVKNIELTLENNVIPRLSHIEQCYVDTFERYQKGIDKLDEMQCDIDIIKITVTGHSEELNKITGPYLVK